jgi:hypothetical protein
MGLYLGILITHFLVSGRGIVCIKTSDRRWCLMNVKVIKNISCVILIFLKRQGIFCFILHILRNKLNAFCDKGASNG